MKLLKTFFAALAILCLASPIHAQSHVPFMDGLKNVPKQLNLPQKKSTANKSSATMSRYIGRGFYDHYMVPGYILYDTGRLYYSGTNTGELHTPFIPFDSCHWMAYETQMNPFADTQGKFYQILDNDAKVLGIYSVDADNTFNSLDTLGILAYTHDSNDNILIEYSISLVSDTMSRTLFTYDNNNNRLSQTVQSYVSGMWINAGDRYVCSYTQTNQLDTILEQTWNNGWFNSSMTTYSYNLNDSVTLFALYLWDINTNTFIPYFRYNISYNNDGCPVLGISEYYINQNWALGDKRTASYFQGTCNIHNDSLFSWNDNLSTWDFDRYTRHENYIAPNLPGERYDHVFFNPGIPTIFIRTVYTYNAYNQLTLEDCRNWNSQTNTPYIGDNSMLKHYYYEEYEGLDTRPINTTAVNAVFYPVPTTDELNIQLNWYQPQSFTITISDITGKVIKSFSEDARKEYQGTLHLADLSAGNYLIILSGINERIVRKFSIVR